MDKNIYEMSAEDLRSETSLLETALEDLYSAWKGFDKELKSDSIGHRLWELGEPIQNACEAMEELITDQLEAIDAIYYKREQAEEKADKEEEDYYNSMRYDFS